MQELDCASAAIHLLRRGLLIVHAPKDLAEGWGGSRSGNRQRASEPLGGRNDADSGSDSTSARGNTNPDRAVAPSTPWPTSGSCAYVPRVG